MALSTQADDFPAWYQEVVRGADLAENSLARGTMVIKPYGYAIWEAIRDALDLRFKQTGTRTSVPAVHPAGAARTREGARRGVRARVRAGDPGRLGGAR